MMLEEQQKGNADENPPSELLSLFSDSCPNRLSHSNCSTPRHSSSVRSKKSRGDGGGGDDGDDVDASSSFRTCVSFEMVSLRCHQTTDFKNLFVASSFIIASPLLFEICAAYFPSPRGSVSSVSFIFELKRASSGKYTLTQTVKIGMVPTLRHCCYRAPSRRAFCVCSSRFANSPLGFTRACHRALGIMFQ